LDTSRSRSKNPWKVLKFGVGEIWRRSVGLSMWKEKKRLRTKGTSYMQ